MVDKEEILECLKKWRDNYQFYKKYYKLKREISDLIDDIEKDMED